MVKSVYTQHVGLQQAFAVDVSVIILVSLLEPASDIRQRHPDSHSSGQSVCDLLTRTPLRVGLRMHQGSSKLQ
jgi:hypothetical protein